MKYIPITTRDSADRSTGTWKATRLDILNKSFPKKDGLYKDNKTFYMPIYDSIADKEFKLNVPFKWEKVLFYLNSSLSPTHHYNLFVEEKNALITSKDDPRIVTAIDLDTLQATQINSVPLPWDIEVCIWDADNDRFIAIQKRVKVDTPLHYYSNIATVSWDGTVTQRGEFTIDIETNSNYGPGKRSIAFMDGKLFAQFGGDTYDRPPYERGYTVIDTDTWDERKVFEKETSINNSREGPPGSNKVLINNIQVWGYVDTVTEEVVVAPIYKYECDQYPALAALGFKPGDYLSQAQLYWHRDSDGNVLYKMLIEVNKRSPSTELQYKHWILDVDFDKIKTDPFNALSNPVENYTNNFFSDKIGKLSVCKSYDKLKELTVFCVGQGAGGSSTLMFGLSIDGGVNINHPFGACSENGDAQGYENHYGFWDDIMLKNNELWFCGYQGIGKISPTITRDDDLLCAWDTKPPGPQPVAVDRSNWMQFWFGGDA